MKPLDVVPAPLASRYVRALLLRHKVPALRQVTRVAEILGFTYTQVHRRMNGSVAWEIEELQKVGQHFGETLHELFAEGPDQSLISGCFELDGTLIPCDMVLGDVVRQPVADVLVATRHGAQWFVSLAARSRPGAQHAVQRLVIMGASGRKRIAIVDRDEGETRSLAASFVALGCAADAFTDVQIMVEGTAQIRYDAYILDWIVDDRSVVELVAMLRAHGSNVPIAIMCGMVADQRVERDIAEAMTTYRLMFFEKPTRPRLVASQLLNAFAAL